MNLQGLNRRRKLTDYAGDELARLLLHIGSMSTFFLALTITIIAAVVAWLVCGTPPLTGIDDAAITRAYAENIANGYGHVYNIGGERVEGATSFLWTMLVTLTYLTTSTPEYLILGLCFAFTVAAVHAALNIAGSVRQCVGAAAPTTRWFMTVALLASPSFFLWSVWTMMEVALWSATLLWLVWRAILLFEPSKRAWPLLVAASLLPLVRPEGVVMMVGLLGLPILLSPRRRVAVTALAAGLSAFSLLTLLRLVYFGFPFPNTYYAKISADRLQTIHDGLKYLLKFIFSAPFVELYIVLWVVLLAWAVLYRPGLSGRFPIFMAAAALLGVLGTYVALGGDIFPLWRFYQPIMPLLPVAAVVLGSLALDGLLDSRHLQREVIFCLLSVMWIGVSWTEYFVSRDEMHFNFVIVGNGQAYGRTLNMIEPPPVVGVTAAGGIALTFNGTVLDLMGLNWTKMAHANPIKVGIRNHASFDKDVFLQAKPDIINADMSAYDCNAKTKYSVYNGDAGFLKGMLQDKIFQSVYRPVSVVTERGCFLSYANIDWLRRIETARSIVLDWSDIEWRNYDRQ